MSQPHYAQSYSDIAINREDGILEMRIHRDGKEALWGSTPAGLHNQLGLAFADIAADEENKAVILTGSGNNFLVALDTDHIDSEEPLSARWARLHREGLALLENLLAIPVPVIGVANGPVTIHSELLLLSDILLASETASFADMPHFPSGLVPGDGVQIVWMVIAGVNRARYHLLTGKSLSAQEALSIGMVGEVLPQPQVLARAYDHAHMIAAHPIMTLRNTRAALTRHLRKRLDEELALSLMLEGAAYQDRWPEKR